MSAGPVIIEKNKVLLVKEIKPDKITPWLFPGGKAEQGETEPEITCMREVKEELNLKIEIIKELVTLEGKSYSGKNVIYELHHFLAKRLNEISPANDIKEWGWFNIYNLPEDCAPNIKPVIEDYLRTKE